MPCIRMAHAAPDPGALTAPRRRLAIGGPQLVLLALALGIAEVVAAAVGTCVKDRSRVIQAAPLQPEFIAITGIAVLPRAFAQCRRTFAVTFVLE